MSPANTRSIAPNEECVARGAKYFCQIDRRGLNRSGKIYDEQRVLRWRYDVRDNPPGRLRGNPFNKPQFVFADADGSAESVIRRVSFVPSSFEIRDKDTFVGRIRMRSLVRIKYSIELDQAGSWTFRLPLFTVRFRGDSETGTDIWVIVGPSKMEWNILIRPGIGNRHLVTALAFIHNEWWNYS
jgi:hypothetical protein